MKNVTMNAEVAGCPGVETARRKTSVSELAGALLATKMRDADDHERAMREALEFKRFGNSGRRHPTQGRACARGVTR